jgi:hypothetical protein
MRRLVCNVALAVGAVILAAHGGLSQAQDDAQRVMELGKLRLVAPENWQRKEPSVRIIAYEFAAPAAKGDDTPGRMTVMAAGGSIEANIQRWYDQFTQPDGESTAKRAKTQKKKIGDHTVHIVDISGTYKDQRGPFAPAVNRDGYRMLGVIIEAPDANYFVKFYGPARTVAEHERAFLAMIEGLK